MQLDAATIATLNRKIGWISLVLGALFLTGAGCWVHHLHMDVFLFHPATAVGEVIDNKKEESVFQDTVHHTALPFTAYRAIVRFQDAKDKNIILIDPLAFNDPSFAVGDHVVVLYNPSHPEKAMIDRGDRKNSVIPLIIGFFSFFMILGGVQRLTKKPI